MNTTDATTKNLLNSSQSSWDSTMINQLSQLQEHEIPSAVSNICDYFNMNLFQQQSLLASVIEHKYKQEKMYFYNQLSQIIPELDSTEITTLLTPKITVPSLSFVPSLRIPQILPSFPKIQTSTSSLSSIQKQDQTRSFSTDSKNDSVHETKGKKNSNEKRSMFRRALMQVLRVKGDISDEEICEKVQESAKCIWRFVSELVDMNPKQVSDYYWKTFTRPLVQLEKKL
ncbi:Hypothetical_protein [Hexamita inflata]|uniref:Hypothetical_protein n=1 Tax=Hexamita inflata TaxID=28002 RepID=A0AA86VTS0_9EUKA|nr:Hypothetical protein HINF_LOCUS65415 [Hexamita inflata]CAI9977773.1 Hypothetical protein HINF_LOCUS65418 [Hexamita inflata]CAI9977776.1 Hypothetical protein HINF_LOCUS65421 [Hexamita inflata]